MRFAILLPSLATAALAGALATSGALADGGEGQRFDSRELLVYTALRDDRAELKTAEQLREEAQLALDEAIRQGAPPDVVRELEDQLAQREAELEDARTAFRQEKRAVVRAVSLLSDDQVFAFNRSLNNALASGLVVDLDADQLFAAAHYDKRQINALTKALESDALFSTKADAARAAYEETHDPARLRQAEHFEAKAESMRERFLGKIERFDGHDAGAARHDAREAARDEAGRAARDEARGEARAAAREAARDAAKEAALEAVRNDARQVARQEARDQAREQSRGLAKGHAKQD